MTQQSVPGLYIQLVKNWQKLFDFTVIFERFRDSFHIEVEFLLTNQIKKTFFIVTS